jgi:hypothetical protein
MRTRTQLARELPAVPLHPFSLAEETPSRLPAGTWTEGACAALSYADATHMDRVVVRVIEAGGWIAMALVRTSDLRPAVTAPFLGGLVPAVRS